MTAEAGQSDAGIHISSVKKVIVRSSKYIDRGQYAQANQILGKAVQKYPENDEILSLYGKSLFESGDQDRAERYFMEALHLNAHNTVAQAYITQIREIRESTQTVTRQAWMAVLKDKVGDLIVFVMSIWLGISLNSFGKLFSKRRKWKLAKQRFNRREYQGVVRILEGYARELDQDEIDRCLRFMLSSDHSVQDLIAIVQKYIIRQEDFRIIERSIMLLTDGEKA